MTIFLFLQFWLEKVFLTRKNARFKTAYVASVLPWDFVNQNLFGVPAQNTGPNLVFQM